MMRTMETVEDSATGEAVIVWMTVTGLGVSEEACAEVVK